MNKQECDILNALLKEPYTNQRALSKQVGHSLGIVNRCIKSLSDMNFLDEELRPTEEAIRIFGSKQPEKAIILAAGFGMRMVPINTEITKGLLEVNGEPLIERIIVQLKEVGIKDIYVVVGFMKEQYEYLIDEYGVELVVNSNYATKNNLHSMKLVAEYLSNCYVIPCDVWCAKNPFSTNELYSWYMVTEELDNESFVRINRKKELAIVPDGMQGNKMIGISYLDENDGIIVKRRIEELCSNARYDGAFWEDALCENDKFIVAANVVAPDEVVEVNTYDQLRELDGTANRLHEDAIAEIAKAFQVRVEEVKDVKLVKNGITNQSFVFRVKNKKYIMRMPVDERRHLINRNEELSVYNGLQELSLSDKVIYCNPEKGYKITEFWENTRNCDAQNKEDVKKCMDLLKELHTKKIEVSHEFDIFEKILFYESLWEGRNSVYRDYENTKEKIFSLKAFIEEHAEGKVLSHIDAVAENFLFVKNVDGEDLRLIDWEYAGMHDPHVDIAMFAIYAMYKREQIDELIDMYFTDGCAKHIRMKIYCYIAACGLLWSNWCEYMRISGVDFGEYSLRQYRYAKDYYRIVQEELMMED